MFGIPSTEKTKDINVDVCIVGSGTAGLTLAREFIDRSFRVCLLESGGEKPDRDTQNMNWGENVGHPYFSLDTARPRYLGGSTNRWHIRIDDECEGVRMRPLEPIDFEKREWVPHSGWPIGKEDLDAYYDRAQNICGITPLSYDTEVWEDPLQSPRLTFKDNSVDTVIFKFGSRFPFIEDHLDSVKKANNIDIYLNASVTEIETDELGKTVTRVRVAGMPGNDFWVYAKLFVLSAGAIENARLLLVSRSVQKNGLGNQNDLVGRFFMEHPHCSSGLFVPSTKAMNLPLTLYNSVHRFNGVPIIGKLSLSEKIIRQERLLGHVVELYPMIVLGSSLLKYPVINSQSVHALRNLRRGGGNASLRAQLKTISAGLGDVASTLYRRGRSELIGMLSRKRVRVYQLQSMSEQIPDPDSRVLLAEEKDPLGVPRIKLDWRLNRSDIRSITRTHEILDGAFSKAGLGRILLQLYEELPNNNITGGWHHMGTTRMHEDPREGVVDENCRVHGLTNLFINGPSVFTTGGYANPALTIVALSIRLADHIGKIMNERV